MRQLNKMPAPRSWRAPAIALIGAVTLSFAAGAAEARCKSLEVLDAESVCNSGECPPGEYIYSITLRNKAAKRLYVAYRFKGPRWPVNPWRARYRAAKRHQTPHRFWACGDHR